MDKSEKPSNDENLISPKEPTNSGDQPDSKTSAREVTPNDATVDFIHALGGLKNAERITMMLMIAFAKKANKEFDEFIKEASVEEKREGEDSYFLVPFRHDTKFRELRRARRYSAEATRQTPRALLVALVSTFDAYLGHLLRTIFLKQPGLIESSQRTLTFSELVEIGSLEAAREKIIEAEIESVLRNSHIDQFKWMETRFDLPLRKGLAAWPIFVELTQRRNLFVHCDGIVSSQYLLECKKNGVDLRGVHAGDRLHLNAEYFRDAHDCLFEIGVKLACVLWRKVAPLELSSADSSLNSICYDLLEQEEYDLAIKLLSFATDTLKKHDSALSRRMFVINRAIASKFGSEKKHAEILDLEDWSDCGIQFQLAVNVLRDDFSTASQIMKKIGAESDVVSEVEYAAWPLFREFRKSDEFQSAYKEIFKHDQSVQQDLDQDSTTCPEAEDTEGDEEELL